MKPDPKTIAFGGVATGIIKAILAPRVSAIAKGKIGKPAWAANAPNTGTRSVTMAKFDITSVVKIAMVVTTIIATIKSI